MYNKKYQLVDIDSKKKGRQLHEEALNRICYLAYFVPGEEVSSYAALHTELIP